MNSSAGVVVSPDGMAMRIWRRPAAERAGAAGVGMAAGAVAGCEEGLVVGLRDGLWALNEDNCELERWNEIRRLGVCYCTHS